MVLLGFLVLYCLGSVFAQDTTGTDGTSVATTNTRTTQNTQTTATTADETTSTDTATTRRTTGTTGTSDQTTGTNDQTTSAETGTASTGRTTTTSARTTNTATTGSTETSENTDTSSTSVSYSAVQITAVNTNNNGESTNTQSMRRLSMPTLSSTGVPVPTVTVPSNSNNPFMAQSSLPEGTVFIAVGAILGGIVAAVFAWHLTLAFIHKRSIKKFADVNATYNTAPLMSENKTLYGAGGAAPGAGSAGGRKGPTSESGAFNTTSERSRSMINSGLFFSPTAEVMNSANANINNDSLTSTMGSTAGVGIAANVKSGAPRASVYMPAGYYGGGHNSTPSMSGGRSVRNMSMYSASNISMSGGLSGGGGGNSLKVPGVSGNSRLSVGGGADNRHESVRAPSAYLDDFLGADK